MTAPPARVLVCTQGFPRHPDDHHTPFLLDHARALVAAGAAVTVLCPSAPGLAAREQMHGVDVVRFRYAPRRLETLAYSGAMHRQASGWRILLVPLLVLGFLIGALRLARSADVLHAHWWVPSGLVAVLTGWLLGRPTVVHLHGTDAAITRGPLRPIARRVLRGAGAVLAAGPELVRWCDATAGVTAELSPMPLAIDRVPDPTPAPADGPVLAVGRLVPEKGVDVLIRAAAAAGLPLEIVGDGDRRSELEALAHEVGAQATFTGALPPAALADRYRAARLVAVPSRREGFGMVAAEALGAGRAVVASDVGGLSALVADGVNGALVPPDDVAALATALSATPPSLGAAGPASVAWLHPGAVGAQNRAAHERAAARTPSAHGRHVARALIGAVAAVAIVLCIGAVASSWNDARDLDLDWRPGPVAGAVAAAIGANLIIALAWITLVRDLGGRLPIGRGMSIWWSGQLGAYLPTGLGSVPARLLLGARAGVARRPLLGSTAAEPLALIGVSAATGALLLPAPLAAAGAAAAVGATTAGVRLLARSDAGGSAGLDHDAVAGRAAPASWSAAGRFVGAHLAQVALRAAGLWALIGLVHGADPGFPQVLGSLGFAYLVGLLAVFAPGGVGAREAALVASLTPTVGAPGAAAIAVAWRLLEVAIVLPGAALAHLGWSKGTTVERAP